MYKKKCIVYNLKLNLLFRPLGQGAFGEVYEGNLICGNQIVRAAIKTLPKTASKQAINDFEMEALIMRFIKL